jgi:plastocyanin
VPGMVGRRIVASAVGAVALVALLGGTAPAPARQVAGRVIAGPGAFLPNVSYLTPVAVMSRGGTATFRNLDVALHNVVSNSGLFSTPLIGFNRTAAIAGVARLAPGNYPFHCSLHPWMRGTLVVRNL